MLRANRHLLNLSSMQLDGSHTPAKEQGEHIGYQGRKACKTTNALFLSDSAGRPVSIATPQAGNHNDLYEIEALFTELCKVLEEAGIDLRGVFMNADAGFDSEGLRQACAEREIETNIDHNSRGRKEPKQDYVPFDEQLYRERFVIERANAWIDGFKTLLVRFEVRIISRLWGKSMRKRHSHQPAGAARRIIQSTFCCAVYVLATVYVHQMVQNMVCRQIAE